MTGNKPSAPGKGVWGPRLGRWSTWIALIALIIAAVGLTLARYDMIPKLSGFSAMLGGGLLAFLALLLGIAALIAGRRDGLAGKGRLLTAIALSAVFVGFLASRPMSAGGAPAIHDLTTDLTNPPQFTTLALRKDNLTGVGTVENWRKIHAAAYPDLAPVTIPKPVAAVLADAQRIANDNGWEVAAYDPAAGRLEATDSVSYIRFKDDVVVTVTPSEEGKASLVNMRSVSRVGGGDLGVNARRIRAFLKALSDA